MNKKHTIFGIGMLWLGSFLTLTTFTFTSANTETTTSYAPKHLQMRQFTEAEKAEMLTKMQERVQDALTKGLITQEEYENFLTKMENGEPLHIRFHWWKEEDSCQHNVRIFNNGNEVSLRRESEELTEEQKAEFKSKLKEKLATALANGKITQAEYDSFLIDLENEQAVQIKWFGGERSTFFQSTPKELTAAEKAEIQTKHKEKIVQELADGKITQTQYDEMLNRLETLTFPMMRR